MMLREDRPAKNEKFKMFLISEYGLFIDNQKRGITLLSYNLLEKKNGIDIIFFGSNVNYSKTKRTPIYQKAYFNKRNRKLYFLNPTVKLNPNSKVFNFNDIKYKCNITSHNIFVSSNSINNPNSPNPITP